MTHESVQLRVSFLANSPALTMGMCSGGIALRPPICLVICYKSRDSAYSHTHGCDLIQLKDTKQNQQKEKAHGAKCEGNQV